MSSTTEKEPVKSRRRGQVQRLSDWDDARWSNQAARAADDLRLTGVHFRLLAYLGRVNGSYGWCELSQKGLSKRWGISRQHINKAVGELVKWHYVEKRGQDETGSALCHYRSLIDPPESALRDGHANVDDDSADANKDDAEIVADVSDQDDTSPTTDVSDTDDTRVTSEATHVSPDGRHTCHPYGHNTKITEHRSETSPPLPPADAGGERGVTRRGKQVEAAIAAAYARKPTCGVEPAARKLVMDHLLAPLVRQRKFDAPSPEGSLAALADWTGGKRLSADECQSILAQLLTDRASAVKPADVERSVKGVLGQRPEPAKLDGNVALMARWPDVLAQLDLRIGEVRRKAWFSTVVPVSLGAGHAEVATHSAFIATQIERDFLSQLRAAMSEVYGEVSVLRVVTRKVAA